MSINVYVVYEVRVCVCKLLGAVLLRTHIAEQRVLLLYYIDLLTTMVYVCFLSIKFLQTCVVSGEERGWKVAMSNNHPLGIQRNMTKRRRLQVVDDEDGFYK